MIRHSSSFFISLVIHSAIAIALFFTWANLPAIEKKIEKIEQKVCVQLCSVKHVEQKPKIEKPKEIIKPQPPKPKPVVKKPKPKPKKKPKPKVKKKKVPKKIIPKKVVPIVKEDIKPQEPVEVKEDVTESTEPIEKPTPKVDTTPQESQYAKGQRLKKDYLAHHLQQIAKLLQENLYYPRSARKRGVVGEVLVKFKLSTDAEAHSIEITSSQSDILSRAAIKTIQRLSGEFPRPKEELILHVPINYRLR